MSERELREAIVAHARSLFARGLSPGTSGNISVRTRDGFVMTPTGASFGALDAARLSRLDAGGRHVDGDVPTKESPLHLAMYEERPDANAIVHLHSTYAVAVACLDDVDADDVLPPLTPYYVMRVGRLPLVPYAKPGDPALGEAVREARPRRPRAPAGEPRPDRRRPLARRRRECDRGDRGDGEARPAASRAADAAAQL